MNLKERKQAKQIIEQLKLEFKNQKKQKLNAKINPAKKERNFTCPHCRDNFLNFIKHLKKEIGEEKAKQFRDKYILAIRKGNWKIEINGKRSVIYCHNQNLSYFNLDFETGYGATCGYNLSAEEKKDFLCIRDTRNEKHKNIINDYYQLRNKKINSEEIMISLNKRYNCQPSVIKKIVHNNK